MSSIAPILKRSTGKIRFGVDDVAPAGDRLPTVAAREQFERVLTTPLLSFSHADSLEVITDELHRFADIHPLVLAVHQAFSQHRPLLLTPDIIWLTIAQGFAQHINNNAESLRSDFVSHQGKERLVAEVIEVPTTSAEWTATIEQWTLLIRDCVGADVYRLLECNFSTTTTITRTASHVVMMDAFQKYFDYVVMCVCGIPEISLLGTVEDWQSIADRVRALARNDLDWWVDRLLPICQEFVNTAAGNPDRDFWQCIYKPKPVYGAELITGWLADLFPYIKTANTGIISTRNPLLAISSCDWPPKSQEDHIQGISLTALPSGISQVNFKIQKANGAERDLELVAGFVGVCQEFQSGTLNPEIGWGVREATDLISRCLDIIEQQHETQLPLDWDLLHFETIPSELMQMLDRFNGATIRADRTWQIRHLNLWGRYWYDDWPLPTHLCYSAINPFIDLEDERAIAFNFNFRSHQSWFLVGNLEQEDKLPDDGLKFIDESSAEISTDESQPRFVIPKQEKLTNLRLIATSAEEFFDRMLSSTGGYYFDSPEFTLETTPDNSKSYT